MKIFTSKQVFILVFIIIVAISFIETSEPIWSFPFLRKFALKLLVYGLISEVMVAILGSQTKFFSDD